MDNVTHALAGALLATTTIALVERRRMSDMLASEVQAASATDFRTAAMAIGIMSAELPDIDLVYAGSQLGMAKLGYLLHHRGYTHTVLFAVAAALALVGCALVWRRSLARMPHRNALVALSLAGTLSHLLLDYGNNYGVHLLWPSANQWMYGDAIFIVEPWFWIVAIPPLMASSRSRATQVALGLVLLAIVVAAWVVPLVGGVVAAALTIGAALSILVARFLSPFARPVFALVMWCMIEVAFFGASHAARRAVESAFATEKFLDVALTPAVSNPFCFHAQIMQVAGDRYRVTFATVAPASAIVGVEHCSSATDATENAVPTGRSLRTGRQWSGSRAELASLVRTNCAIAAAMRFMRVPEWGHLPNGNVAVTDVRFGESADGFASVTTSDPSTAGPRHVPTWTPPRKDLLAF